MTQHRDSNHGETALIAAPRQRNVHCCGLSKPEKRTATLATGSTSKAIASSPGSIVSGGTTDPVMMISPLRSRSPKAASTSATWRTMPTHSPVLACGSLVRANSLPRRMTRQVRPSDALPARAGPARAGSASDGLTCRVIRRGSEFARTSDPQANTGEWVGIVRHVADVLAAFGERLRSREIIITGSVVPPLAIEPGEDAIGFEVDPIGAVNVRFSGFNKPQG